jgi:hypothetical protein
VLKRLLLVTGFAALIAYFLRWRPASVGRVEQDVDPGEELRRKLDEARDRAEPEPELSDDLDARRREVHDRARASADEMRGSATD